MLGQPVQGVFCTVEDDIPVIVVVLGRKQVGRNNAAFFVFVSPDFAQQVLNGIAIFIQVLGRVGKKVLVSQVVQFMTQQHP